MSLELSMQLHPTGTDPTSNALLICRNVRWNLLVLFAILWAIPIGLYLFEAPLWGVLLGAILPALLTWPLLSAWRKRGRPDNWVLAVRGDGFWLNLRDSEYYEAEPGKTVVELTYSDIEFARRVVHRYTTPSGNGKLRTHKDVYLELRLNPELIEQLGAEITAERQRALPEKQLLGGFVKSRTGRTNMPIETEGEDAVRVKFSAANTGLTPSIKRTIAMLREFVTVEEDHAINSEHWRELSDAAFDDLVLRLAMSGQQIDASNLLQRRRGMTLTEAKNFVDELRRDKRAKRKR
jgi:hypothetical protein